MVYCLKKIWHEDREEMIVVVRPCEYDDYPISPYDYTIPPDERARLIAEADAKLKAIIDESLKQQQ